MQGGRASFTSPLIDRSLPGPGPAKKRKRNPGSQRHWDEPEQQSNTLPYDEDGVDRTIEEDIMVDDAEEEEESRELAYDEIWDDSALIAAWESATAEYEVSRLVAIFHHFRSYKCDFKAYHGKGKDWKKESVKRSPLLSVLFLQGTLANPPSIDGTTYHQICQKYPQRLCKNPA